MLRIVKISLPIILVLAIIIAGLFFLYLNDSEFQLAETIEKEMGLVIPDNYSVINGEGTIFNLPIDYTLQFIDKDFIEFEARLQKTKYYNDTVSLRQFLEYDSSSQDNPKRVQAMQGLWLETDTSYFYLLVEPPTSEYYIIEATLNKRTKTFHAIVGI